MEIDKKPLERLHEVRRIFEDNDFGNFELLEGWDGDDLSDLRAFLTDEEFERLLDELQETER